MMDRQFLKEKQVFQRRVEISRGEASFSIKDKVYKVGASFPRKIKVSKGEATFSVKEKISKVESSFQ
jgi:transcriptional regulator